MSSRGVNKVILIGNIGSAPETRYLPNGNAVTNVTLATSETWKDKQTGQPQERTEWHRVIFFGKLAEIAGQYLEKGSQIYVEGRLQTRKWQGQDGQDRYTTEIVVDQGGVMQMLGGRGSNEGGQRSQGQARTGQQGGQQYSQQARQQAQQSMQNQAPSDYDSFDEEIPF